MGLTLKVGTSPVGTPGFMAPELFDKMGQEISSEKVPIITVSLNLHIYMGLSYISMTNYGLLYMQVDVFAYGMTLYELLSFRSPFDNIPLVKRNFKIREKQRPMLKARETRSLVLLQDLMAICWSQEPEDRPDMSQVREWIESPEFERLRTEVDLQYVRSISCACVCRILPENEEECIAATNEPDRSLNISSIYPIPESGGGENGIGDGNKRFDNSPEQASIYMPSAPDRKTLFLTSTEHNRICIETDQGVKIQDEEDSIYQFVAPRGVYAYGEQNSAAAAEDTEENVQLQQQQDFDPYTQIWLCGKNGLLQIFTYNDNSVGHYVSKDYSIAR